MSEQAESGTFVGRTAELTVVRAALERASSGDAATVLVSGEAGVGKSRLVAELMRTPRDEGALVLLGRCVDVGDGELAYAPIAGVLRSLAAQVDGAELDTALGSGRAELAPPFRTWRARTTHLQRVRGRSARSVCSSSCSERAYYTYWEGVPAHFELYERPGSWVAAVATNDEATLILAYFPQSRFDEVRTNVHASYLDQARTTAPALFERMQGQRRVEPLRGTGDQQNFFRQPTGPGWALVGDAGHHKDSITARDQ